MTMLQPPFRYSAESYANNSPQLIDTELRNPHRRAQAWNKMDSSVDLANCIERCRGFTERFLSPA